MDYFDIHDDVEFDKAFEYDLALSKIRSCRPSYVYFIQAGGYERPIKIGFSSDISKRMSDMQIGIPDTLRLVDFCLGGKEVESCLHKRLSSSKTRGEWFNPTPAVFYAILESTGLDRLRYPKPPVVRDSFGRWIDIQKFKNSHA